MLENILSYGFVRNALAASLLTAAAAGTMGTFASEKRQVMVAGGIAHTAFGGIGLGFLLGIEPVFGAFVFALVAALVMAGFEGRGDSDLLTGIFWSAGMASGIIFVNLTPGYPPNLNSYLFGDILLVSRSDLRLMSVLVLFILLAVIPLFNLWKHYLFDEVYLRSLGIKTGKYNYLFYILLSLTVVVLIRSVGIILAISLLTVPTATASCFTEKLEKRVLASCLTALFLCLAGLAVSYWLNMPSGAVTAVLGAVCFFACRMTTGRSV